MEWTRRMVYRTSCSGCDEILREGTVCECNPAFIGPREDMEHKYKRARIWRHIMKSRTDKATGKYTIK